MADTFKAILISRDEDKKQSVNVETLAVDDLMEGDVVVNVEASTVNYKDGLCIGPGGVRRYGYPRQSGI